MSTQDPDGQEEGTPAKWQGFVLFLSFVSGSKSEGFRPFLVIGPGESHRLYWPGDNPFENETLRPLQKAYCEVEGEIDEKKNLIHVSRIAEKDDPFTPPAG